MNAQDSNSQRYELMPPTIKREAVPVSICVLTFNRSSLLRELLLSLRELSYRPLEIIVVDNNSEDKTPWMMVREFKDITYFRTERNVGAAARNVGIRNAAGEIIITLDDDIMGIKDQDIEKIVSMFLNPRMGAINLRILDNKTGHLCNWVHHCSEEDYGDKEFRTYEITEGAVAFRKKVVTEAGYYPESYFLSHEGLDLAMRILDCGFDVTYTNQVSVTHCHANSGRENWINYYYDTRNQCLIAARLFPLGYAINYLSRGLLANLVYSVRDGYAGYWAKAVFDGVRGFKQAYKERKPLSRQTIDMIRAIDGQKPGLIYMVKKRLFHKGMRL